MEHSYELKYKTGLLTGFEERVDGEVVGRPDSSRLKHYGLIHGIGAVTRAANSLKRDSRDIADRVM